MSDRQVKNIRLRLFDRARRVRTFGCRPIGQEHQAWVDHHLLRAHLYDPDELEIDLKLGGLRDPRMADPDVPAELRALIRATHAGWAYTPVVYGLSFLIAYGAMFAFFGGLLGVRPFSEAAMMVLAPSLFLCFFVLTLLVPRIEQTYRSRTGAEPPGSRARALQRALDRLEARPFVVRIGDLLVENLPSLSQLTAWQAELEGERDAMETDKDYFTGMVERIAVVGRVRPERAEPERAQTMREAIAAKTPLIQRIDGLLADIVARGEPLHRELDKLRSRARLDARRARADTALERPRDVKDVQIATSLDLDLADLSIAVNQLRDELRDERLRVRALF